MSGRKIVVTEPAARLDVWLSEQASGISRKRARELCEEGKVLLNGRPARAGAFLKEGSVVEVLASLEVAGAREILPEPGTETPAPLDVHFEDQFVLVVRKPRGIATITLRPDDPYTLADILVSYGPAQRDVSPDRREAGLLQRLDYWTSGLLIAAKTRSIWERLRKDLLDAKIKKSYLSIVEGNPKKQRFSIDLPLVPAAGNRLMQISPRLHRDAMEAKSEIEVLRKFGKKEAPLALVRVRADRARRHQVRVHLASQGYPLLGDRLYGAKHDLFALGRDLLEHVPEPHDGFLLHAESLAFRHPVTMKDEVFFDEPDWAQYAVAYAV